MEKRTTIGILAHVDAGKTTLAEAMLYRCGAIRKAGRVDHGDAHMDTHSLERARGITIFASQAQLQLGDWKAALLDTPDMWTFRQRWSVPSGCWITPSW